MATIKNATLKLWIYTGIYGGKDPENPTYTLYKERKETESTIIFDIAELVKDYIEIVFTGDYDRIRQSAWVEYEVTRVFDDETSSTLEGDYVAYNGYGDFEEGINPRLNSVLLQSNTTVYIPEGEPTRVPLLRSADGVAKVDFYLGNSLLFTQVYGDAMQYVTADTTNYTADTTQLNADITLIRTPSAVSYTYYKGADKMIITASNGSTTTVNIKYVCEPKHTPYKITFLNKFGILQDLWFFKKRVDTLGVTRSMYKRNILDLGSNGISYSRYKSTKELYNITSDSSFIMNTGFLNESHNEVIRQLLLTENAWISEGDEVYAVTVKTESIEEKTIVNEKLLNFTIEFEYAYNDINNVR